MLKEEEEERSQKEVKERGRAKKGKAQGHDSATLERASKVVAERWMEYIQVDLPRGHFICISTPDPPVIFQYQPRGSRWYSIAHPRFRKEIL